MNFGLLQICFACLLLVPTGSLAASGQDPSRKDAVSHNEQKRLKLLAKQQLLFLDPVEQSYDELARLDPGKYHDLERMIERGKVLLRRGQIDQGKIELHKALALLTEQINVHKYDRRYFSFRTQVNRELGRIDRAIKDMEMVVELTPPDASPMVKMGNFVRLENLRQLQGTEIDVSDTLEPEAEYGEEDENAPERANQPGKVMIGNL